MSKSKNQADYSGLLSDRVTVRKVNGKLVVATGHKLKKVKLTPKLKAQRERFQEAVTYAKRQDLHEESKALYSKGIKTRHESVYTVALADYLNLPKVSLIDTADYRGAIGDVIAIKAKDDFMVTQVKVVIKNEAGTIIEQGEATEDPIRIDIWNYTVVNANSKLPGTKIIATAYDRPRNKGTMEIVL